LYKSE